ncbi:pre-peptidase C-terminal domain-containing protein [Thalassomonas actiniarum]|uniref:Endonuclease/exonuclease/phosphatase family protein n=1 Tax=Thalassomonas actiniarum TaxID=485447 RepID=A0AAF0C4E2_9GAMM|nr:pre-peptidase C-terminal domain-containing protein [Thalassomonas actiniarum]WDD99925.1 endonuclease/exonuclease/phosphatase family protein [Thalassomonas actiniarum]
MIKKNTCFIRSRAVWGLCAVLASPLVFADEIKIMSYNVLAGSGWESRMLDVAETTRRLNPDIVAFQEALPALRRSDTDDQQSALERALAGSKWHFFRWNQEIGHRNCAPIALDTSRFTPIANGSVILNFTDEISQSQWQDLWDLHDLFHKDHTFVEFRYLTWLVVEDNDGKRYSIMNTHYETYPEPERGAPDDPARLEYFRELLHRVFQYMSNKAVEQGELLRNQYGATPILLGDFEYGDLDDPAIKTIVDGGYQDTWLTLNVEDRNNRRAARGIDHIFADKDLVVKEAYYDWNADASDHQPLIAVLNSSAVRTASDASFTKQDITGKQLSWQHFDFLVPDNSAELSVAIRGGKGEAGLYVNNGKQGATRSDYVCKTQVNGHQQACVITAPKSGAWTLSLYGYSDYSGIRLEAVTKANKNSSEK